MLLCILASKPMKITKRLPTPVEIVWAVVLRACSSEEHAVKRGGSRAACRRRPSAMRILVLSGILLMLSGCLGPVSFIAR